MIHMALHEPILFIIIIIETGTQCPKFTYCSNSNCIYNGNIRLFNHLIRGGCGCGNQYVLTHTSLVVLVAQGGIVILVIISIFIVVHC